MGVKPGALYDSIFAALRAVPSGNLSTAAGWRDYCARTDSALRAIGVELTRAQIHRACTADEIRTLWDKAEYVLERHFGRQGLSVIWPTRANPEFQLISRAELRAARAARPPMPSRRKGANLVALRRDLNG